MLIFLKVATNETTTFH